MAVNRMQALGRMTDYAKIDFVGQGERRRKRAKFTIALNRKYRDAQGNPKEEATFLRTFAFGHNADALEKWGSAGCTVYAEGPLKHRQYKDDDGIDRHLWYMEGLWVEVLGRKPKARENAQAGAYEDAGEAPTDARGRARRAVHRHDQQQHGGPQPYDPGQGYQGGDDDIPF